MNHKKRFLAAFVLAFALVSPAFAALTATMTTVSGGAASPTYYSVTTNGALNGATPITATVTVGSSVSGGSWLLILTSATDAKVITARVYPSACAASATSCSVFSGTATVGNGADGATTTVNKVFAFPTSGVTFPPGNYTISIVSDGATTATVVGTLLMQVMP